MTSFPDTAAQRFVSERRSALEAGTRTVTTLNEEAMLRDEGALAWRAASFEGRPCFYPVYRWGDLYSYSPLNLVIAKGGFAPVPETYAARGNSDILDNRLPFEAKIERVGGPPAMTRAITDPGDYVAKLAEAVTADVAEAEAASTASRNVVMCGGKDSLNLLLVPYAKPVVAYSAQPNTPLVQRFVEENQLDVRVEPLEDEVDAEVLVGETLENLGRSDLAWWKWSKPLARVAAEAPTLFWKGQMGAITQSPHWKTYRANLMGDRALARRVFAHATSLAPAWADGLTSAPLLGGFAEAVWARCARAQGDHMGFLRALTGAVFRSAYNGPRATSVWSSAYLPTAAHKDIRPALGAALLGRKVWYPDTNPGPGPAEEKRGLNELAHVTATLRAAGIPVADAAAGRAAAGAATGRMVVT